MLDWAELLAGAGEAGSGAVQQHSEVLWSSLYLSAAGVTGRPAGPVSACDRAGIAARSLSVARNQSGAVRHLIHCCKRRRHIQHLNLGI